MSWECCTKYVCPHPTGVQKLGQFYEDKFGQLPNGRGPVRIAYPKHGFQGHVPGLPFIP